MQLNEREILAHAGSSISHQLAMDTANKEYEDYSKKRQIAYDKKGNAFDTLVNQTKKLENKSKKGKKKPGKKWKQLFILEYQPKNKSKKDFLWLLSVNIYAKREGHAVFKIYSDEGISGYSDKRPALQELLKDAKLRRFDLAIAYK